MRIEIQIVVVYFCVTKLNIINLIASEPKFWNLNFECLCNLKNKLEGYSIYENISCAHSFFMHMN
jgi:hypothetical protein